jgi:hypothetical protein
MPKRVSFVLSVFFTVQVFLLRRKKEKDTMSKNAKSPVTLTSLPEAWAFRQKFDLLISEQPVRAVFIVDNQNQCTLIEGASRHDREIELYNIYYAEDLIFPSRREFQRFWRIAYLLEQARNETSEFFDFEKIERLERELEAVPALPWPL